MSKRLIYEEDAIDALAKELKGVFVEYRDIAEKLIGKLPSATPEKEGFSVIDVKTGEEADTWDIALNEDWAKHLMYCDMEGFAIEEDGTLILLDECGQYAYCPIGRFDVRWK